ncbi:MAG: type II secretion system protein [Polyangiaceae bacterium]|nr:type II secretion system protein [Polyangiaceae bacterium]MCW5791918.1 type II secretion system protein [Polyangiaceae bacterium]
MPSRRAVPSAERGFTLLEVLVAVAILGLGLSVILSAQTGLFQNATRAENLSVAPGLIRCKMNELELDLLRDGYSVMDQHESGPCCEEDTNRRFSCDWSVELIKLPEPRDIGFGSGDGGLDIGGSSGGLGALGALAQADTLGASGLGQQDLGGVASMLTQSGGNPIDGVASIVMGMVYPQIKPMFEASIRKITVKVRWKEGKVERDLSAVQYVASPQQGGFDPNAAAGLEGLEGVLGGSGLQGGGLQGGGLPGGLQGGGLPGRGLQQGLPGGGLPSPSPRPNLPGGGR